MQPEHGEALCRDDRMGTIWQSTASNQAGRPDGLEDWLKERFFQHRGNAEVVRQDLARELSIEVSPRTVERAVAG